MLTQHGQKAVLRFKGSSYFILFGSGRMIKRLGPLGPLLLDRHWTDYGKKFNPEFAVYPTLCVSAAGKSKP
jgi:hypothetical protein